MTLSISDNQHKFLFYYAECHILFTIMLNVTMLNVIMLNVIMLNVIMLNVIMLNVVMLSVVAPLNCLIQTPNTKPKIIRLFGNKP